MNVLNKPYARTFLINEDGVFTAAIVEFPGCIAEGSTIAEAYQKLDDAAEAWVLAMEANGHPVPEPFMQNNSRHNVTDLYKLWIAVEKWEKDFFLSSPEELARTVRGIIRTGPRKGQDTPV